MKIIAIETSHDDTSVVLYQDKKIIRELSFSQTEFHQKFGGTIPEYAARGHFERLPKILDTLLREEDMTGIDHIAYTNEPGLIGSLHMGKLFAHGLGMALNVPVKKVNHMHGHIFAVAFTETILYPAVALVVSGGHTQLWEVKSVHDIHLIGETLDDAVGEVYDKVARYLHLGFPGGPKIDKMAQQGKPNIDFHLVDDHTFNMSFSGLKTKVKNYIHNLEQKNMALPVADICASFQEAIVKILMHKTQAAINRYHPASIILGGGVAANSSLRAEFKNLHKHALVPAMQYTTDNAMMIAITSLLKQGDK